MFCGVTLEGKEGGREGGKVGGREGGKEGGREGGGREGREVGRKAGGKEGGGEGGREKGEKEREEGIYRVRGKEVHVGEYYTVLLYNTHEMKGPPLQEVNVVFSMEPAHVVCRGTVRSVHLGMSTHHTIVKTWTNIVALTHLHLLVEAIVEDERVGESKTMGLHGMTLAYEEHRFNMYMCNTHTKYFWMLGNLRLYTILP